jgi:hypothetical protein
MRMEDGSWMMEIASRFQTTDCSHDMTQLFKECGDGVDFVLAE